MPVSTVLMVVYDYKVNYPAYRQKKEMGIEKYRAKQREVDEREAKRVKEAFKYLCVSF